MYLQKEWQIRQEGLNESERKIFSQLNLADQILFLRGYTEEAQRNSFLQSDISHLHDPFLFRDMSAACDAIIRHGSTGNLILVHGDYDVDGLTSTALVIRALRRIGYDCDWVVPDRLIDGYGLSQSSLDKILDRRPGLVITVDCGIASVSETAVLQESGIEIVITDHHECPQALPQATALINPKLPECGYPFTGLAGVGVALKLLQALDICLDGGLNWQKDISLAALGTVADVVPLLDENRIIVKAGLKQINQYRSQTPAGLCAMTDLCSKDSQLSASVFGYSFAPRLNAAGRLGNIEPALELLLCDDSQKANELASVLNELNRQRQALEQKIMEEAIAKIESDQSFVEQPVLIIADTDWHPGVIGIVCSRLVEQYRKPVIMLAGDNVSLRGSCRTYGEFDVLAALESAKAYTVTYGGHKKAAGLELRWDQLQTFVKAVNEFARLSLPDISGRAVVQADMLIDDTCLTLDNVYLLARLEPFGESNQQPLFVARGFEIINWRLVGNGRHVKLSVKSSSGKLFDGIAFGLSDADELFGSGDKVDLLFALEVNVWQGREKLQLMIRDIRHSDSGSDFLDSPWLAEDRYNQQMSLTEISELYRQPLDFVLPSKADYKSVYQYIKSRFAQRCIEFDLKILARRIAGSYGIELNPFKLARVLTVFEQSGLINIEWLEKSRCRMSLREVSDKVRLELAPAFQRMKAEGES